MTESEQRQEKLIQMTQTPVEKLICGLAVPSIATMMISACYNMADTYFVGQIGTSATGAVGVVFSLMAIIQAIGFFFGHGSGNCIARQLGAQQTQEAEKMAATGFFSALILGAALALLGTLFLEPLARLLGATETILPHACAYLQYILLGMPWMAGSLMLNNLLRFQGSAFYGMLGMGTGAVLNIGLDPLFIFVFDMGVGGAALATMISQLVGCVILLVGCTRKGNIRINPKKFKPGLSAYREIVRGGLPSLGRQSIASMAVICLNHFAGGYGDAAIAAMSIVSRVAMFANSAVIGFGQGFQPVCGYNYGAQRYDRVRRAFWFCVRVVFVFLLVISALGFAFAPEVVGLFRRDDAEVIRIGALALRLQCVVFPLNSWIVLCSMMTQTAGLAFKASALALARQGIFYIPGLFILVPAFGILGIQICQPLADLASFFFALPIGLGTLREMKDKEYAITHHGPPVTPAAVPDFPLEE